LISGLHFFEEAAVRKLGTGKLGRVGALLISFATVIGCGDNGVTPPDATPIDAPEQDAFKGPSISDVPDQTIAEDSTTGSLGFTVGDTDVAVGSLTVPATSNNTSVVPDANIVLGGSGASRTVTVTPAANQFGSATITLTVNNGQGKMASSDFTVTVTSVNDAPTISNVANQTVQEGAATSALAFTVGDVETPAASLTVTGSSSNTALVPNANIVFGGTGAARTVTITPAATGSGTATITLTVSDGTNMTSSSFILTVVQATMANDPPINQVPGAQTTPEDVNLVFSAGNNNLIAVSDVDAGGSPVRVTLTLANTTGSIGTLSLSGTTGLTFTAGDGSADTTMTFTGTITAINAALNGLTVNVPMNGSGTGTLTIVTNDQGNTGTGGPQSDTDTVAITVTSVNDLPTISNIADVMIAEDTSTSALAFTIGDTETAATALTVTATSSNQALIPNGSLTLGGSGANRTITATPLMDQFGTAIITVTVTDANGGSAQDTFTVTVTNVNDAPTISDVPNQSTNLTGPPLVVPFTVGDSETPAGTLAVTINCTNTGVSGAPVLGGSGANRTVTFTPTSNGMSNCTLTVSDGALTTSDSFVLTVNDFNDPPVNTVPGNQLLQSNITGTPAQRTLAFTSANRVSVADPDAGTLPISVTIAANMGGTFRVPTTTGVTITNNNTASVSLSGAQAAINTALQGLTFTANSGFFGDVQVTMTSNDNGNSGTPMMTLMDVDQFTIHVNALPTITGLVASTTVNEDGTQTLTFIVADADNTAGTITTAATSSNGTLISNPVPTGGSNANRTVTLTPNPNQNNVRAGGPTIVTVTITDSNGGSTSQDVAVSVPQVNDAPVLNNPTNVTGSEDAGIVFGNGANAITFTDIDQAAQENPNGNFQFNLTANQGGLITLGSTTGVTVTGNGTGTVQLTGTLTNVTAALNGATLRLPANQFNSPAPPGVGPGTLTVTVSDLGNGGGAALADTDNISFSFAAVNDAPTQTLTNAGIRTLPTNMPRTGIVVATADIDDAAPPNGPGLANTYVTTVSSADGTITLASTTGLTFTTGDGTADPSIVFTGTLANTNAALNGFTFNPTTNFTGDARVTVTTNDAGNFGTGGALQATSNIFTTYTNVANTAPTVSAVANQTLTEDTAATVTFTVGDAQTNPANLDVSIVGGGAASVVATLGGSGANRTVTLTPAANFTGNAGTFTITVSDGTTSSTAMFTVNVTPVNDAPVIPVVADQTTNEDTAITISFSVGDVDNALTNSSLTVTTDNPALFGAQLTATVPGGTCAAGATCTASFTVNPAVNASGSGNITVSASDGTLQAQRTFRLTVNPVNDAPTVTQSGRIIVSDQESTNLRVRLFVSSGNTISLGTTTGVSFVDCGSGAANFAPDGTADGDGVDDQFMCISGSVAALNTALDDLVTTGGTLSIRVDDQAGAGTTADYAAGSQTAVATRNNQFGPNTFGQLVLNLSGTNAGSTSYNELVDNAAAQTALVAQDGFFNNAMPTPSFGGAWGPGDAVALTTAATNFPVTPVKGWIYQTDLQTKSVAGGTWTAVLDIADYTNFHFDAGNIFIRASAVTGSPGSFVQTAVLTQTSNRFAGATAVAGWQEADQGQFFLGGPPASEVTVTFSGASAHLFLPGEKLLVEVGFGDPGSSFDHPRAWELFYNNASNPGSGSRVITPP